MKNNKRGILGKKFGRSNVRADKELDVGDRLKDGTIVLGFDKDNNVLCIPKSVFGGKASFWDQYLIASKANSDALHGHKTWSLLSNEECTQLATVWNKVAPPAKQGRSAPWFWGAHNGSDDDITDRAVVYRNGEVGTLINYDLDVLRPVPVVLRHRGSVRS